VPPVWAAPFVEQLESAYLFWFSHFWLATPQLVLQADWQEVWHSPQPPFFALSHRLRVSRVLIRFIIHISVPFEFDVFVCCRIMSSNQYVKIILA
jgi:hypothetical protein